MNNRKEYMKKYRQEHKEAFRIAAQKYRDKDRKKYNEYDSEYRKRKRKEAKENAELVVKYKEVIDKIKEFCNEQIKLANIEIDKCCRWRNADKEKYIITETNLPKAFLIKKCNKRILRVIDLVENDKYYNAKQIYEEELLEEIE